MAEHIPFFSIIVPTYNRAGIIGNTLSSLVQQTADNYEIIVVDDGSTDDTESVVRAIGADKIRYYKKENAERGAARNYGAIRAKGDFLNFFDSDDLAYPNHISEANRFVMGHQEAKVFALGYQIISEDWNVIKRIDHLPGTVNNVLINGNCLGCNGVFVRKDIFEQYHFNEYRQLAGSEDWLLWLQLAARFNFYFIPVISSALINRQQRSVLQMEKAQLIKRKSLFYEALWKDEAICAKYGDYRKALKANGFTYIALHLALSKKYKLSAIQFLLKALIAYPAVFVQRRFWATIKHLL